MVVKEKQRQTLNEVVEPLDLDLKIDNTNLNRVYSVGDVSTIFRLIDNLQEASKQTEIGFEGLTQAELTDSLEKEGYSQKLIDQTLKEYDKFKSAPDTVVLNPSLDITKKAQNLETKLGSLKKYATRELSTQQIIHSDSNNLESDVKYDIDITQDKLNISVSAKTDDSFEKLYDLNISTPKFEQKKPVAKFKEYQEGLFHRYTGTRYVAFGTGLSLLTGPLIGFGVTAGIYGVVRLFERMAFSGKFNDGTPCSGSDLVKVKLHDTFVHPFKLMKYNLDKLDYELFVKHDVVDIAINSHKLNSKKMNLEEYLTKKSNIYLKNPDRTKLVMQSLNLLPSVVERKANESLDFMKYLD